VGGGHTYGFGHVAEPHSYDEMRGRLVRLRRRPGWRDGRRGRLRAGRVLALSPHSGSCARSVCHQTKATREVGAAGKPFGLANHRLAIGVSQCRPADTWS
jgi:hypothetical protein